MLWQVERAMRYRVLIQQDERALGIFTERDLLRRVIAKGKDPESFATNNLRLRFIMTRPMLGRMISHWDCRRRAVSVAYGKSFRGKIIDTRPRQFLGSIH